MEVEKKMTDSEMLEELKRAVMALNAKNYCVWEALHWLEASRQVALLYEQGKGEDAAEFINRVADYSRRFEARYLND